MKNALKLSISKIIILLFTICTISSCDKTREGNGIVLDSVTKQPLDSVNVDIYLMSIHNDSLFPKVYTNAKGEYHVKHEHGRKMVQFSKEGYIGYVADLRKNDTIYMEVYHPDDFE
ncbi:MAG: hypothetical protein H6553_12585 [Chitinophagales bacterium]|nr:hypothetical protein [Chitinophagales bacterium]